MDRCCRNRCRNIRVIFKGKKTLVCTAAAAVILFTVRYSTSSSSDPSLTRERAKRSIADAQATAINATLQRLNEFPFINKNGELEFLHRWGLFKSEFGTIPSDKLDGGGIWGINEKQFEGTKGQRVWFKYLMGKLGVNWLGTTYPDLKHPLQSAIAAVLVLKSKKMPVVPPSIPDQAALLHEIFHHPGTPNYGNRTDIEKFIHSITNWEAVQLYCSKMAKATNKALNPEECEEAYNDFLAREAHSPLTPHEMQKLKKICPGSEINIVFSTSELTHAIGCYSRFSFDQCEGELHPGKNTVPCPAGQVYLFFRGEYVGTDFTTTEVPMSGNEDASVPPLPQEFHVGLIPWWLWLIIVTGLIIITGCIVTYYKKCRSAEAYAINDESFAVHTLRVIRRVRNFVRNIFVRRG